MHWQRPRGQKPSEKHRRAAGLPLDEIRLSGWRVDLDAAAIADIRARYRAGATLETLAREAGCSVGTMRLALG